MNPTACYSAIELTDVDVWNIRECDDWALTHQLREQGQDHSRRHWVYVGTVLRLDHCGQTAGKRALISPRGYVATPLGIDYLLRQLYREALERVPGPLQGRVPPRGSLARRRALLGRGERPLWQEHPGGTRLCHPAAPATPQRPSPPTHPEPDGSRIPRGRRPDRRGPKANRLVFPLSKPDNFKELIGAGKARDAGTATPEELFKAQELWGSKAIESTCRQYPCRFKRTGQFWTVEGAVGGAETPP